MKKSYSILILIVSSILLIFTPSQRVLAKEINVEQTEFINSIKDEAINGYKEYNILPSLTIAQAILESSWGQSKLTIEANNFFGIKAYSDWTGDTYTIPTKEYTSRGYIYIDGVFKAYATPSDSIKDHSALLATERYAKVRNATNYSEACYAILDCGYATSPNYPEKLIEIIECFNLYEIDNIAIATKNETDLLQKNTDILKDPIVKTALDKNYEGMTIFKDNKTEEETNTKEDNKEDTNNIPIEIAHESLSNQNKWYVIYCLLQNFYPEIS